MKVHDVMPSRRRPWASACAALAASLTAVLLPGLVLAGWTFDPRIGASVCDTIGHQTQTAAVSDGTGGILVAWIDTRNGASDLFAQRLTGSGDRASGWPHQGLAVCVASGAQTSLRMLADGEGGAIVAWTDFRSGNADIYAQRITAGGAIAAGWPASGRVVCGAGGSQSNLAIAGDGAHGALIAWQDARSGTHDIYAQHVLGSGAVDPAWPADGRAVSASPADQLVPCIAALPGGAAIVGWQDTRSIDSDVFAQRIDAQGAAQWGADGVVVCSAVGTQERPVIASDGQGGAFFAWTDYRETVKTRVYAQHLLANGSHAPFWQIGGNALGAGSSDEREPFVLADGAGGLLAAWVDTRWGGEDVFMTRIDGFGATVGAWAGGGTALCEAGGSQNSPRAVLDGQGSVIVAWRDARNDSLYDVFATRFTLAGDLAPGWVADGLPLGNARGAQAGLALVPAGNGAAIGAWSDLRNLTHWDVYANRAGPDAVVDVRRAEVPCRGHALAVSPNPASGDVSISFRLPLAADVEIAVFDVHGRRIRMLCRDGRPGGTHVVAWDGRDDHGATVGAGTYFARLKASGAMRATRFVISR